MPITRKRQREIDYNDAPPAKRLRPRPQTTTVVSWNLQGGGKDVDKAAELRRYMNSPDVAAICLQECGRLFDWNNGDLPLGWEIVKHEVWNAGGGNNRCSLAILARGGASQTKCFKATWMAGKPMIGAKISGNIWVWCVHAPRQNSAYVASACETAKLNSYEKKWLCVGDFNLPPNQAPQCVGAIIRRTGSMTQQSGRELDYGYISVNTALHYSTLLGRALISDHWAIEFELRMA